MKRSARSLVGVLACYALLNLGTGCADFDLRKTAFNRALGGPDLRERDPQMVSLNIDSDPKYATLYQANGNRVGVCPQRLTYSVTSEELSAGEAKNTVEVRWVSGARTKTRLVTQLYKTTEKYYGQTPCISADYVVPRPEDAPKLELDLNWALRNEDLKIQQRQASAASSAADAAERAAKAAEDAETRRYFRDLGQGVQETLDYLNKGD